LSPSDEKVRSYREEISQRDLAAGQAEIPSESTKFVFCEMKTCEGGFCLICEVPLMRKDLAAHECISGGVSKLYAQVLEVLARASSRKCPHCGESGIKDLECTHVQCQKCDRKWCYVCQKPDYLWDANHNIWGWKGEESSRCPKYLELKYGDKNPNGHVVIGDPAKALEMFHIELQQQAIEELKNTQDPSLWKKMTETYFPNGIFQEQDRKQS
jgi:hypothetical protein